MRRLVEFRINRTILMVFLFLIGLAGALGVGMLAGRYMSPAGTAPAAATAPSAPGALPVSPGAVELAPGAAQGAVPPVPNPPEFGELTPEQDAAVARIEIAEAVAKVGQPNVVIVDTRAASEFQNGHIQGAISMPAYDQDAMLETLPKDKEIILYCA